MADRILLVKLSALGDLFHAVPVAHALRAHFGCPVDWVTQPEYVELIRCHTDVERVISFPRRGRGGSWLDFVGELRRERYSLALDLQGLFKSGLVLGLCRAGRKLACARAREGSALFANERPALTASGPHALDVLNDSLLHLGIQPGVPRYPLCFPGTDPLPGTRPRLAIAPKSRWPAKDWPLERFRELAFRLRAAHPGLTVTVLGAPGDRADGDRLLEGLGEGVYNLCGLTPLLSLGAQLREVDVLLCNDSGPMHFAAAVGTPVVALFGPTDPSRTGPVGPGNRILRPAPGPEGYPEHRSYKDPGNGFISRITVDEVAAAVESLLGFTPNS